MKSYVVNYQRVVFRKVDPGYLTVPACNKMCLVHPIALDLEDPLVFYTSSIRGHKTFLCLAPYMLLVHISEFFLDHILPFCMRVEVGIVPSFSEGFGLFRYRLGVNGHQRQMNKKF